MAFQYSVKCDSCGKEEPGWTSIPDAWVIATYSNGAQHTYCPDCWEIMFCSVIKPNLVKT
jgi:hypothetical protein